MRDRDVTFLKFSLLVDLVCVVNCELSLPAQCFNDISMEI